MTRVEVVWRLADGWERLTLVALVVATVAQTAFILIYGLRRTWYRVLPGRAMMMKSASLAVILWLSLLNTFVVYPGQEAVGALAFCAVTLAIVYQLAALVRTPNHLDPEAD